MALLYESFNGNHLGMECPPQAQFSKFSAAFFIVGKHFFYREAEIALCPYSIQERAAA